ncbi:hypothetical protein ACH4UM_40110 [Streptomyces sp. NPDC020801]|uniref:hypothetical protein n=1 Tax=unclassified Streptomyces TaxID=2593676 RepID=UPI00378F0A16
MNLRTTSPASRPRSASRQWSAALIVVPVLALAVACGGGDGSGVNDEGVASVPDDPAASAPRKQSTGGEQPAAGNKSAFYDAQLKYVQCMRSKGGIKEFPDPKLSGYLDWGKIDQLTDRYPDAPKGGKDGACGHEMSKAMNLEPKRDSQKVYESMLAHAKCMRDKGISKFKNPTMSGGNVLPGGDPNPANPSFDTNSPAYKQAREACKDKLLDGLDGMQ